MSALEDVNTLEQTAAYLKIAPERLVRLARARQIGAIKEGRKWTFPREAVETYVSTRQTTAVASNPWGLTDSSLRSVRGRSA